MINGLVMLYAFLFLNFGIAIIAFTLLVRLALVPLTVKQSRQIKAMGRVAAEDEGDSGSVQGRQAARFAGDDEAVPRAGREPARLSRSHVHPVPHLDRLVPGDTPDRAIQPGKPGRTVAPSVRLAAAGAWRHTHRQQLPVDGSGAAGSDAVRDAGPGRRIHVGHAEDDHDADGGRASGVHQPHDAVDDARHVRLLHAQLPKRPGAVLGRIQRRGRRHPGIRYRVGPNRKPVQIQARRVGRRRRLSRGVDVVRPRAASSRRGDHRCGRSKYRPERSKRQQNSL